MSKSFEDLKVFEESRKLTKQIYQLTNNKQFNKDYGLKEQIRRASISIMSNIAEGYERNSDKEFAKFLGYSKGSCGEVRAQLLIAKDLNYINDQEFDKLYNHTIHISRMIYKYIDYLKHSN